MIIIHYIKSHHGQRYLCAAAYIEIFQNSRWWLVHSSVKTDTIEL